MMLNAEQWLTLATHGDTPERAELVARIERALNRGETVVIKPAASLGATPSDPEMWHWELR